MSFSIAAWLGAIAIGVSLGLLGSGGSILTVPVLLYLFDQPERVAIAGSLAIVGLIALVGAIPYILKKQTHWQSVVWFGIPGMIGTYGGAFFSQFVTGAVQLITFAVVMLMASFFMLKPKKQVALAKVEERKNSKILLDGLLVGVLTGFVGVGGGFLIVPALVLLAGLSMHQAVATSLVIIFLKSFAGFYKYLDVLSQESLSLDWQVIGLVTILGILGSFSGNLIANKISGQKLKTGFALFLLPMAVFIIWQNLGVFN
ncbi:sulfite exporter TauE/SafE family protein [Thalassotalea marina]|uniref:Probable membrane transporter protein n=1 Tax=Thalassotalea marina TaxID=1673741 RepID=A0A919BB54_9GAMM|nr:sulfite exporter TauE/SafE family protein [Thalassotalea marina]GHF77234.1 UPF0721 transmembrane protein [Thalassotalea marina]